MMDIQKLYPEFKDYVWGGTRLITEYGKQTDKRPCAESWELSFHPNGLSRLSDGRPLRDAVTAEDLGENAARFPLFPLMIKFIDAASDLSVQVHPSDGFALANEHSLGKTEMWYVVDAAPGAGVFLGFDRPVTAARFENAARDGSIMTLLNFIPVAKGDCLFVPAGTVHAIGAGCLICEIQQNSDLTYRVYDYGRGRPLHIGKALAVADLSPCRPPVFDGVLGECRYFSVSRLDVGGKASLTVGADSFRCLTCVAGSGTVGALPARKGDSFFVPANSKTVPLSGDMTVIVTRVP